MKLLSFQPFSLFRNGGGSRVLRRLYEGHESQVTSLVIDSDSSKILSGDINEIVVRAIPGSKRWMRWYVRLWIEWIRVKLFWNVTTNKICMTASSIEHDVIHVVNHGKFSTALCEFSTRERKPLWVSFHDHFLTCSSFEDAKLLWEMAERRFVISEELAREYQNLFGLKKYEIVTDGVKVDEVSEPINSIGFPVVIYFAGLMHWDYLPLLKTLSDAIEVLVSQGYKFKLILRGSFVIDFLNDRSFEVEYRSSYISEIEIKKELDAATILYLPIKFTDAEFYLYSLSTKMIQYLGASGTILYHGPRSSAACKFLKRHDCAVCCESLEVTEVIQSISNILNHKGYFSKKAKAIASSKFNLRLIQDRFWLVDKRK